MASRCWQLLHSLQPEAAMTAHDQRGSCCSWAARAAPVSAVGPSTQRAHSDRQASRSDTLTTWAAATHIKVRSAHCLQHTCYHNDMGREEDDITHARSLTTRLGSFHEGGAVIPLHARPMHCTSSAKCKAPHAAAARCCPSWLRAFTRGLLRRAALTAPSPPASSTPASSSSILLRRPTRPTSASNQRVRVRSGEPVGRRLVLA